MPIAPTFPGVYIQEVPSGVHTITGVATSIAAFIGRTSKGKMNKATRVLSLSDYIRTFGDPHPMSDLAQSVRLFFTNGGTDCYVIRIANGGAPASLTLNSFASPSVAVLVVTAKAEGRWGDTVRLEVDYNTQNPDETFNLRVIHEEGGVAVANESFPNLSMNPASPRFAPPFVSQSSELVDVALAGPLGATFDGFSLGRRNLGVTLTNVNDFLEGLVNDAPATRRSKFEISVNDSPFMPVDLNAWPFPPSTDPGPPPTPTANQMQDFIALRINTALGGLSPAPTVAVLLNSELGAAVGRLLRITATNGDRSSVRVRSASSNDLAAALMLGVNQGGVEPTRFSNFRPAPTATMLTLGALATPGDVSVLNAISNFAQSALTGLTIDGTAVGPFSLQTSGAATDPWSESAPVAGSPHGDNDGVREKLRIIASAINSTAGLPYRAEVWGYHLAIIARGGPFSQLPAPVVAAPALAGLTTPLNAARNGRQYTLGSAGTGPFSLGGAPGSDGVAPLISDYVGDPVTQKGLHALDPIDIFNLLVIPADGEVTEADHLDVVGAASTYAAERRAFLLVDGPPSWTVNGRPKVVEDPTKVDNDVRKRVVKQNSAVFYPRLVFSDNGLIKKIGASGAIAGLMARIDSSRGVWKAPAGTEADLRGIVGLEVNLTDAENGVLNKIGCNCERQFPSGLVNWGARTLDGHDDFGSEWKYIPIRRLALFLEESLFRGTKWIVFEPNDEPLWSKIRLNINAFMMSLFRQGAFQGSTPDKAFYVKCDAETTTQNDRNLGIVNIEVGFAPLKPAEFVIIKIQQIAGEL
ncbi:MAG TPA: phage tail sheath C-terminal domain-containing protein [Pyrinomonadaceae bacterium]|nr:phage tail sheath C-terminal domain-containing protein [Pyrinomonadaceae bacterium]